MTYLYYSLIIANMFLLTFAICLDRPVKGNTHTIYADMKIVLLIAFICSLVLLVYELPYLKILLIIVSFLPSTILLLFLFMMLIVVLRKAPGNVRCNAKPSNFSTNQKSVRKIF